jgi:acetylglutamate synthase
VVSMFGVASYFVALKNPVGIKKQDFFVDNPTTNNLTKKLNKNN